MKLMLMVPFVDDRLLARILDRLKETFGGNLQEIIIGGAALNKDVERFLRRCNFPYTVGYGMTECGPLIAYAPCTNNRMASSIASKPKFRPPIRHQSPAYFT